MLLTNIDSTRQPEPVYGQNRVFEGPVASAGSGDTFVMAVALPATGCLPKPTEAQKGTTLFGIGQPAKSTTPLSDHLLDLLVGNMAVCDPVFSVTTSDSGLVTFSFSVADNFEGETSYSITLTLGSDGMANVVIKDNAGTETTILDLQAMTKFLAAVLRSYASTCLAFGQTTTFEALGVTTGCKTFGDAFAQIQNEKTTALTRQIEGGTYHAAIYIDQGEPITRYLLIEPAQGPKALLTLGGIMPLIHLHSTDKLCIGLSPYSIPETINALLVSILRTLSCRKVNP